MYLQGWRYGPTRPTSLGIGNSEPVCCWRCELTRPTLTFSHPIYPHLVLLILSPFVVGVVNLFDLPSLLATRPTLTCYC